MIVLVNYRDRRCRSRVRPFPAHTMQLEMDGVLRRRGGSGVAERYDSAPFERLPSIQSTGSASRQRIHCVEACLELTLPT